MGITNLMGAVSFLLYCVYFMLFFMIHLKNKEYNPMEHALSDYDIGSTHKLFQVYSWVSNLGILFLSGAFFFSVEHVFPRAVPLLLLLMIACRIGVSIFKTTLEGERLTPSGIIHYLFAIGSFALAYIIIDKVDTLLLKQALPNGVDLAIRVYGYAITAALIGVCITMFKPLRRFFALIERLYILLLGFWFLATGVVFAAIGKL
jgi:hypothetical protein